MARQHVFLIPGFFGFANLGDFAYFGHVRQFLSESLAKRGVPGEVTVVATMPTASLTRRAQRVLETIAEVTGKSDGVAHLIGHSSGGLDARLLASPDVALGSPISAEEYARKIRTVVSLSTPHRGTPLATFLSSLLGQQFLRVLSLTTIYTLRTGRVPIAAVFHLVRLLALKRLPIAEGALLNQVYRDLLADFSHDRRVALEKFFVDVGVDQDLLGQVTPAGMETFGAGTFDRPGVRYGSVVTCARAPGVKSAWQTGLSPFRQATHALFTAFYTITQRVPRTQTHPLTTPQVEALARAYGKLPVTSDNDGMVPTLSQVYGEVVHAAWGDHLDALGHFYEPTHDPPHFDWLNSGAHFTRRDFEAMWNDVASFILA